MTDIQLMIHQQEREAHLKRVLKVYATKIKYLISQLDISKLNSSQSFGIDNIKRFEKNNNLKSF